jgi:hypothetical protein
MIFDTNRVPSNLGTHEMCWISGSHSGFMGCDTVKFEEFVQCTFLCWFLACHEDGGDLFL